MKDSGLRIRIERELREKFIEVCRQQDRPAAQVIREFMRQYISDAEALEREEIRNRSQDANRRNS
jgi:predicted DNA-binding protein